MRPPVEETAAKHERIVKKASRPFREREFENVGLAEVMKAIGLTAEWVQSLSMGRLLLC